MMIATENGASTTINDLTPSFSLSSFDNPKNRPKFVMLVIPWK
jgi:hypothetical protein